MFESPTPNESRIEVDQEEIALIGFLTATSGALLGEPMSASGHSRRPPLWEHGRRCPLRPGSD